MAVPYPPAIYPSNGPMVPYHNGGIGFHQGAGPSIPFNTGFNVNPFSSYAQGFDNFQETPFSAYPYPSNSPWAYSRPNAIDFLLSGDSRSGNQASYSNFDSAGDLQSGNLTNIDSFNRYYNILNINYAPITGMLAFFAGLLLGNEGLLPNPTPQGYPNQFEPYGVYPGGYPNLPHYPAPPVPWGTMDDPSYTGTPSNGLFPDYLNNWYYGDAYGYGYQGIDPDFDF